ncbi:MAG: tol-pal system protein YbgF [Pseudomonadota bacterium]
MTSRGLKGAALVAAMALGLGVLCAPNSPVAQGTWTGSSSKEDLLYRLGVLDAEIADIRARLGGVTGGNTVPSITGTGGDTGAMENEIRRLTGKVEQLENQIRTLNNQVSNRLGDIEFRLNELEGVPNDGGGTSQPLLQNQGAQVESSNQQVASISERGDLDRAIGDVNQGRFDQAEDRLRRFLNSYPNSPMTGEAWFWLGESQFVRGNLVDASRSYLNGYNSERQGSYAPDNLYKLGVSLGRVGQVDAACSTLREVRSQFPSAARGIPGKADAEADQLSCV